MNDPVVPSEPPDMDRYRAIGFANLRRFIHDIIEKLSDPSTSGDEELPRSREELLVLCDMLKAKADALKEEVSSPKRPTYDGPPDPE